MVKLTNGTKIGALAAALLLLPQLAWAQNTERGQFYPSIGQRSTVLPGGDRTFGMGIELGSTTGLSLKYFMAEAHALQLGVGAGWVGGAAFQVDASYLYHLYLVQTGAFSLPLFAGGGARLTIWPDDGNFVGGNVDNEGMYGIGFFIPVGLAMNFQRLPLDLFVEANVGLGFVADGVETGFLLDGTAGARFYF